MNKLIWMINRLQAMSAKEMAFRAGRSAQAAQERFGFGLASRSKETASFSEGQRWCHQPDDIDAAPYVKAADRILSGRFDVFCMDGVALGFPPKWNRDPRTGTNAPLSFGKAIDYRNESLVGDIKYLWEPNRHLELVTLAQAWALTRDQRYSIGLERYLRSWFAECPYPFGPNWTSSLESGLRLVNWAAAWQIIGGLDSPLFATPTGREFRDRWCTAVYQHLHFIAGHLSRHSSANNHLLGECLGWLVGSLMWPMWPECRAWAQQAKDLFLEEALKQNGPDGVNRERAIYYQYAVIDMMFVAGLAANANRVAFPTEFWNRLERMLEFLASITDAGGNVPMFGDADDAVILGLNPGRNYNVFRSVLSLGAVHFGRGKFAACAEALDERVHWLMEGEVKQEFGRLLRTEPEGRSPITQAFPEGGYWVLGGAWGSEDEVRIVVDAGPLGYLATAAHGHSAALAFTLSLGGKPVLIDSGTYAYHTMQKWRNYFRGTSAHNTVRVDGVDQSLAGGSFLWVRHANARCVAFSTDAGHDRIVMSHDGYTRLSDPITHRREVLLAKVERQISVVDELDGTQVHEVEVFWHFAPDCVIELADQTATVCGPGMQMSISLASPLLQWELSRGVEDPPLGWTSDRFDRKRATTCLRGRGHVQLPASWKTTFCY
jgi:Heparinase II/III-like protein/Heparinase II/III N-terminus